MWKLFLKLLIAQCYRKCTKKSFLSDACVIINNLLNCLFDFERIIIEITYFPLQDGFSPLVIASLNGHLAIAKLLLGCGANPNLQLSVSDKSSCYLFVFYINCSHMQPQVGEFFICECIVHIFSN